MLFLALPPSLSFLPILTLKHRTHSLALHLQMKKSNFNFSFAAAAKGREREREFSPEEKALKRESKPHRDKWEGRSYLRKGGRETFVVVLGFLFVKYSRIFRAEGREERE